MHGQSNSFSSSSAPPPSLCVPSNKSSMSKAETSKPAWLEFKSRSCHLLTSESLNLSDLGFVISEVGSIFLTREITRTQHGNSLAPFPLPFWLFLITADPHHPSLIQSLGNTLPLPSCGSWGLRVVSVWTTLCICLIKGPEVWTFRGQDRTDVWSDSSPDA